MKPHNKNTAVLLIFLLILSYGARSQDTHYGPTYQSMLMNNPAFSGATADGTVRLSYLNFYPGNSYGFHSFYASYDSYFGELHGGAGLWIADDYLGGIVNDLRGGMAYAYTLRAGKEIYVNAGLGAAFYHRGFSFAGAVLPDMIDRLGGISYPSAEVLSDGSRTVLDISTGFLLIYRKFFAGLSVNHLSEPDLSQNGSPERLRRRFIMNASWLKETKNLGIRPMGFLEIQEKLVSGSAGASAETQHLSMTMLFSANNAGNSALQAGFAVNTGRLGIFYNYRFSLKSASALLPVSLMHQAGLSFSLNRVDKRDKQGTISMPQM